MTPPRRVSGKPTTPDLAETYALLNDLWALTHNEYGWSFTERKTREHLVAMHERYGFPITLSIAPSRRVVPSTTQGE